MAKSKKKDPSDMITEVEIMYKDCVPGQIMPDGREFLGIKKFPDGVAVAMFNSAKRDPETIRQNRRNLEEVFNSILAAHGCDTYYPLIFPPREGVDFFPLSVDFEEKQYSVGKIPGGFIKREGRPTEKATLTCRLIDRPLRPLFPKGMRNDVQVVATCLSVDKDIPPEVPAMIGSSAALSVSDIPWGGPTGTVVVGCVDGELVLCPDAAQREKSTLLLTVSGTKDAVLMVEAGAKEVPEELMLRAILFGHEEIKKLVAFIEGIQQEIGKEKAEVALITTGEDVKAAVREYAYDKCRWVFETTDRHERQEREAQVKAECEEHFAEQFEGRLSEVDDALYYLNKEIMRARILTEGIRPDGRGLTDVRPIWCEVGILPRTHGSAVFTRGETQALTVTTLGSMSDVQILDGLGTEDFKRYIHHYNMPPYATGEAGRMKSPGRREIGHGALAERALLPVIPPVEEFPYAIRVVSEVVSSNGSTSQGSICGSTLALMDAGVPISAPVAGISCGLIQDDEGGFTTFIDIQGVEDFHGEMDFKVAGTKKGITAIQMDLKNDGLTMEIIRNALDITYDARCQILDQVMLPVISEPRPEVSKYAPKMITMHIDPDRIREVIGKGGSVIQKIVAESGAKVDIDDDGTIHIASPDAESCDKAKKFIDDIVFVPEVGKLYYGRVVRLMTFGAFVEIAPGKDGLVHISKLADKRIEKVEDACKVGDMMWVKVTEIDEKGRVNLSHKDAMKEIRAKEAAGEIIK